MFGFSSKKNSGDKSPKSQDQHLAVYTIPKEFYAGADPVIDLEKEEKLGIKNAYKEKPVKISKDVPITSIQVQTKVRPGRKNFSHTSILLSTKILAITTMVLFLVFVVGVGQYYWEMLNAQQYRKAKNNALTHTTSTPPTSTVVVVVNTSTVETPTTTQPVEIVPTTTPALAGGLIEFPSILLGDSADLDGDKLTDAEEELFSVDPGKADTDGDGYEDNTEIYYLYSPNGFAPTRLVGSGPVTEFTNPIFGYKIYYPTSWVQGSVDQEYRDVLFSTITGENVEVRVFDKTDGKTFEDWFTEWAKGEQLGQLKDFQTVFKEKGKARNDNLVYYFEDAKHYYLIVYHITGSGAVNYRNVITMMARSFRTPADSGALLPEQQVIRKKPAEAAASSTP
jgi:hypothetical protein